MDPSPLWSLFASSYADHTIALEPWPVYGAAAASIVAWVGGIAGVVAFPRGVRPRWVLGIVAAVAVPVVLAIAWASPPLLAAQAAKAPACEGCGPALLPLFFNAWLATGAIASPAMVGASLAAFALAAWPGRLRTTALGAAALLACVIPFFASTAAFTSLAGLGNAPWLDASAPPRAHVGADLPATVTAVLPPGFTLDSVPPIDTSVPGRPGVTLTARAPGVTVTREIAALVHVGAEVGTPHFPIREGAAWRFRGSIERGREARFLFTGGARRTEDRGEALLRIGPPVVQDGLRRFALTLTSPEGDVAFEAPIYAFDGEVFATIDGVETRLLIVDPDPLVPYGPGPTPCAFVPLAPAQCTCNARPGGPDGAPPGPIRCRVGNQDTVHEIARGLTLLLSIGVVDIGSSRNDEVLVLDSFDPGDPQLPGVAPAWDPGPGLPADVEALLDRLARARRDSARLAILRGPDPERSLSAYEIARLLRAFDFELDQALILLAPHLDDPSLLGALIDHEIFAPWRQEQVRSALGLRQSSAERPR